MPQGQKISPELQWAIVRLSSIIGKDHIAAGLDLSIRTVRHVLSHFDAHGTIPYLPPMEALSDEGKKKGNRHLRDADVEFLLGTIQKVPDLYLDELQEVLATTAGVEVSRSTVWRTLHRAGFTMKK
ncbi:hypothetical protein M404DRAFT_104481, partial [Pisolithus tinctorius Marx 270]